MILAKMTTREIAEALGVSVGTVSSDRQAVEADFRDRATVNMELQLGIDLARLDFAINAIWPQVEGGDPKGIEVLIRLIDRRAKMIGYDAPKKKQIDVNDPAAMAAIFKGLPPKERAQFMEGLAEIKGLLQNQSEDKPVPVEAEFEEA